MDAFGDIRYVERSLHPGKNVLVTPSGEHPLVYGHDDTHVGQSRILCEVIADVAASFRPKSTIDHDIVRPKSVHERGAAVLAVADLEVVRCLGLLVFERLDQAAIVGDHHNISALKVHLPVVVAVQTVAFTEGLRVTDRAFRYCPALTFPQRAAAWFSDP